MDTNFTIRLDGTLKRTLDKLAKATGRSRAFLAQDALRQYLEEQDWQVAEIKKAVKEADAGTLPRTLKSMRRSRSGELMRVSWLRTALANFDAIGNTVARDNLVAARETVRRIVSAIEDCAREE